MVAGALLVVALLAPSAHAVSCANPDNLCTGNPCVTGGLEVSSPCVVDFGDRALVIRGTLKIAGGGVLSLKAGSIDVRRPITGKRSRKFGAGADITLTAIRDITVRWRVDASARTEPGSIHLIAGGDVNLLAPLRASTKGLSPSAPGGTIVVDAGGELHARRRARIRANGAATTPGGVVQLSGARGVELPNRISAFGSDGGSVAVTAAAGNLTFERPVNVEGVAGAGGHVSVRAPNGSITLLGGFEAEGLVAGGAISVLSGGAVSAFGALRAGSVVRDETGGSVTVVGAGDVLLTETVTADGSSGGLVVISSQAGTTRLDGSVVAVGSRGIGGRVVLVGGTATVVANAVDADGATDGGTIEISGGSVSLTSSGSLFARGHNGGTINIGAAAVNVAAGARVLVDGDQPGGIIRVAASAGDLLLDGDFRARGRTGGRIEGMATGDVVANGDFAARGSGGCIGLSAGSTLDTSGGLFDVPVVAMCP